MKWSRQFQNPKMNKDERLWRKIQLFKVTSVMRVVITRNLKGCDPVRMYHLLWTVVNPIPSPFRYDMSTDDANLCWRQHMFYLIGIYWSSWFHARQPPQPVSSNFSWRPSTLLLPLSVTSGIKNKKPYQQIRNRQHKRKRETYPFWPRLGPLTDHTYFRPSTLFKLFIFKSGEKMEVLYRCQLKWNAREGRANSKHFTLFENDDPVS